MGGGDAVCRQCDARYERRGDASTGGFDLRPNEPFEVAVPFVVGAPGPELDAPSVTLLDLNPDAGVDFTGVPAQAHLGLKMMSWLPPAPDVDAVALDLGCGDAAHRQILEHAGYIYVGVDFDDEQAPFLADAHCLPFADDSFDLVFTVAVFEHLRNPLRAMQEVARVLKPGGELLGSAAFLEPFHARSYFHHTALGVLELFDGSGLSVRWVKTLPEWDVLRAQREMLYPKLPKRLADTATGPTRWLSALWWRLLRRKNPTYFTDARRLLHTSGAFAFAAHRDR